MICMQRLNPYLGLLASDVATLTNSNPGAVAICSRSTYPYSEQCWISDSRQECLHMAVVISAFEIYA